MWVWLAIMGLGIGPSMAVFTIIVQNAVPVREHGRSDQRADALPPDRRHVGLAIAGTVFGSSIISGLASARWSRPACPAEIAQPDPAAA